MEDYDSRLRRCRLFLIDICVIFPHCSFDLTARNRERGCIMVNVKCADICR